MSNLINKTKTELVSMVEQLQSENTDLKARLENPNAEQIAEYKQQAQQIQDEIDEIRKTDPNSNEIHNLASRKSRANSFIKVLGGEAVHVNGRRGGTKREFTPEEMQAKVIELLRERKALRNLKAEGKETLESYKRQASVTSELSKWRKKLKEAGFEPIMSLEEVDGPEADIDPPVGAADLEDTGLEDADDDDLGELDDDGDDEDWGDDDDGDWDGESVEDTEMVAA